MIDPQLKQKVVLVTGANHGIGAATAKAFAMQESNVFLTYYREPCSFSQTELNEALKEEIPGEKYFRARQQQTADGIVDEIRSQGIRATAWETDLGIVENIFSLFDRCEEELGPVDILVNNHTMDVLDTFDPERAQADNKWFGEYQVELIDAELIDENFSVNSRAYALLMMEYLKRLIKRGAQWGRIINISTDAAHCHEANVSYAASKHAIESYSRSAAMEMGKYGVTVNIVSPGPIQTGYMTPDMEKNLAANAPLRRVGLPEDVADAIVFLASEQARWITGQLLYVGGGWRMHQ